MGCVYLAFDLENYQFVALKTLFAELYNIEEYSQRFIRETRLYRKLSHPHIVAYIDGDHECELPYVALEYVSGDSLETFINSGMKLPIYQSLRYVYDLADALITVHENDIIHRDIKPPNMVVNQDGCIKLLDFGVASVDDSLLETKTGMMIGTRCYASPEQNQGQVIDHRADIYSLGVTLWELLTGKQLFDLSSGLGLINKQFAADFEPPSTLTKDIPKELDELVLAMLDPHRDNRPKSAAKVKEALEPIRETVARIKSQGTKAYWFEAYHRAFAMTVHGKVGEAKDLLSRMKGAARRSSFQFLLGKIAWREEQKLKALEYVNNAIRLEPNNTLYRIDLVRILLSFKMLNRAQSVVADALKTCSDDVLLEALELLFADERVAERFVTGNEARSTTPAPATSGSHPVPKVVEPPPPPTPTPLPKPVETKSDGTKRIEEAAMDSFLEASANWQATESSTKLANSGEILFPFGSLAKHSGCPYRGYKFIGCLLLVMLIALNLPTGNLFPIYDVREILLDANMQELFLKSKESGIINSLNLELAVISNGLLDYLTLALLLAASVIYLKAAFAVFASAELAAAISSLKTEKSGLFSFSFTPHPDIQLDVGSRLLIISAPKFDNYDEEQMRTALLHGELEKHIAGSLIVTKIVENVATARVDLVSIPLPLVGQKGWCCHRKVLVAPWSFLKKRTSLIFEDEEGEEAK